MSCSNGADRSVVRMKLAVFVEYSSMTVPLLTVIEAITFANPAADYCLHESAVSLCEQLCISDACFASHLQSRNVAEDRGIVLDSVVDICTTFANGFLEDPDRRQERNSNERNSNERKTSSR
jgi:hypothetical protein